MSLDISEETRDIVDIFALTEKELAPLAWAGAARGLPDTTKLSEQVLLDMAREKAVDMPIATAVAAILDGQLSVDAAIENLLTRPLKAEG